MNDERMIRELAKIRLTLHWIWLVLPLLSLGIRVLFFLPLQLLSVLPEATLFLGSLASLIYSSIKKNERSMIDERTIQASYDVVRKTFYGIIGGVIAVHFFRFAWMQDPGLFESLFVNGFLSFTFAFYYLTAIHKGIYFNYEAIESSAKEYWTLVFTRIGAIAMFYLIVGLGSWGLSAWTKLGMERDMLAIAALLSMIFLIGQYLVLSWLERVHAFEQHSIEHGYIRLFHKTAVILMVALLGLGLIDQCIHLAINYLALTNQTLTPLSLTLQIIRSAFFLGSLDRLMFTWIALWFLRKHLQIAFPSAKAGFLIGFFFLVILSILSLVIQILFLAPQFFFPHSENLGVVLQTVSRASMILGIFQIVVYLILALFLLIKGHRFALWHPLAGLVSFFAPALFASQIIARPLMVNILYFVVAVITMSMSMVFWIKGSKTDVLVPSTSNETQEQRVNASPSANR